MKNLLEKSFSALCLVAVLITLPAQAAMDMFLDLGSAIPGESLDTTHKNQVEVLAWGWGMSKTNAAQIGGGKVSIQELSLTKWVDKASPLLMLRCANSTNIPTATLYIRKPGAQAPIEFIKIIMTDVIVTSVSTGGSGGEDRLTENISLNFAKVEFDYVPTKADGTPGTMIPFRWDIAQNATF